VEEVPKEDAEEVLERTNAPALGQRKTNGTKVIATAGGTTAAERHARETIDDVTETRATISVTNDAATTHAMIGGETATEEHLSAGTTTTAWTIDALASKAEVDTTESPAGTAISLGICRTCVPTARATAAVARGTSRASVPNGVLRVGWDPPAGTPTTRPSNEASLHALRQDPLHRARRQQAFSATQTV
jgi:hypothetical protein